jgi:hypothetical protein
MDIREWSRVNRAFCDLLHRGADFDPAWEPEAMEAVAS